MLSSILYLGIHSFNLLVGLVISLMVLQRYKSDKVDLLLILFFSALSWVLANLCYLILYVSDYAFYAVFSIIFQLVAVTFIMIFADRFEGEIKLHKLIFPVFSTTLVLGFGLFSVYYGDTSLFVEAFIVDNLFIYNLSPIIGIIVLVSTFLIGYWIFEELSQSQQYALSHTQLSQIKLMKIGLILSFFVAPIFDILGTVLSQSNTHMALYFGQVISYLAAGTGIAFIGMSYVHFEGIAILQPQQIKSLLVIQQTGIPLFRHDFSKLHTQTELISGAIAAISSVMQEAFEITSKLTGIYFKDEEIMVEIQDDLAFILLVGRKSEFLETSLKKFANLFIDTYKSSLEHFTANISVFDEALDQFKIAFGYGNLPLV